MMLFDPGATRLEPGLLSLRATVCDKTLDSVYVKTYVNSRRSPVDKTASSLRDADTGQGEAPSRAGPVGDLRFLRSPRWSRPSSTEISVDPRTSRRSFLSLALGAPIAGAALASCGSSGPSSAGGGGGGGGGGGAGAATYWFLTGQPQQA